MDFEIIFRNATLIDGTLHRVGDLGVRGGHIAAIGDIPGDVACRYEIDATHLVVSPGFIDIHTHSDVSLFHDPRGESKVRQGVTTEVVGNCGFSAFPLNPSRIDLHTDLLAGIGDDPVEMSWSDLSGYASALETHKPAINIMPLIGHGAVRIAAMGIESREPEQSDLKHMRRLVDTAMEQGAWGISTGLTYVPSGFGTTEEIVSLAEVVAWHGGIYATHARVQAGQAHKATEEAATIGRRSGARVQFSHVAINEPDRWGTAHESVQLFDRARQMGVDIAFDVYPYEASASSLTQYLPTWLQAGGSHAMAARLCDGETRRRAIAELAAGWYGGIEWDWHRVLVSRCGHEHDYVGHSIATLAEREGVSPPELALRLCERHGNHVQVVLFYRIEEDMLAFLKHELASVGSDGSAIPFDQGDDRPHPRFFGAFPRILGRYVRDRQVFSLQEAIAKMTAVPAERLGLLDRGRLAEGQVADVVAFDAHTVIDRATYTDPCQPPSGIQYVVVNGEIVVDANRQTDARPGRVLLRR